LRLCKLTTKRRRGYAHTHTKESKARKWAFYWCSPAASRMKIVAKKKKRFNKTTEKGRRRKRKESLEVVSFFFSVRGSLPSWTIIYTTSTLNSSRGYNYNFSLEFFSECKRLYGLRRLLKRTCSLSLSSSSSSSFFFQLLHKKLMTFHC